MELKRDGKHSPGCTAVVAHRSGRLRSPWSAVHRIEAAEGESGGQRWYVVPCADPRCSAVRRILFARPEAPAVLAHKAA